VSGLFVVFEGGDGVGKSTQARMLAARLRERGREVVQTCQPGGTAFGLELRRILLSPLTGELSPRAEALLYAADKAQHLREVVLPALAAGKVVVCDRYVDSTLAYQGAGRALEGSGLRELVRWATDGVVADLTVLLDLDPAEGVGALAQRDRMESAGLDFHERVRAEFLRLARSAPERYLVVPARESKDGIAERVFARVESLDAKNVRGA
jgi:dTMP kinase